MSIRLLILCSSAFRPTLLSSQVDLYCDHVIREEEEDAIVHVSAGGGHSCLIKKMA